MLLGSPRTSSQMLRTAPLFCKNCIDASKPYKNTTWKRSITQSFAIKSYTHPTFRFSRCYSEK